MPDTLRIEVHQLPPKLLSPNAGKYHNPAMVRRIKTEWQSAVAWAIKESLHGAEWTPCKRAEVTFERVIDGYSSRRMDDDNLANYFKHTRDVLKPNGETNPYGMGIIAGDDPTRLIAHYTETKDPARSPMTIITVERKE